MAEPTEMPPAGFGKDPINDALLREWEASLLGQLMAADAVIRDLAHAIGPHCQGCAVCKATMRRHADRVASALRARAVAQGGAG